mmetsp:Transcript_44002/g.70717  ORF Transcript_44002/g.70717 Transcript_44002/m.70717 type:complete len:311 (+) Transcript_44002:2-934(+)
MRLWLTPEAMQSYGWRIALWIGLIPCVITFITHKDVSDEYTESQRSEGRQQSNGNDGGEIDGGHAPLNREQKAPSLKLDLCGILLAIGIYVGGALMFYLNMVWLPVFLQSTSGAAAGLAGTIAVSVFALGLIPIAGCIIDKVDPYLIGMAARGVNAVLAAPLCLWLFSSPSLLRYAVVMAVMLPFLAFDFVSTTKILVPYFPAEGRYISMAIANNAGVGLTGGTAPMIAQYLIMSFDHGYVLLGCYVSAALFTATLSVLSLWCRPRCHFKGGPNCVSLSQEEVRNKDSPKMASFISNSKLSSQAITIREA